ncbi:MAG: pyridoxamine 5'-phosphate oxidase family protein [Nitrososphaeraceae archaeon]
MRAEFVLRPKNDLIGEKVLFFMLKILDGSGESGTPLTEQDVKDFFATRVLNVHLGTVDENDHANIHPAWYYFDDSKEKIYVETRRHSKKMENLKGMIRFTFV